ncbi:hypothetical protein [Salinibius halmophilus]|uniref:hypothetical protein n=1 Tax=Salinibius halmophilus TaxID=1853216 RepID=UPI000E668E86|nr:hypothetical protein [Salinibius halmophilus]
MSNHLAKYGAIVVLVIIVVGLAINNVNQRNRALVLQSQLESALADKADLIASNDQLREKLTANEARLSRLADQQRAMRAQTSELIGVLQESVEELKSEVAASQSELEKYQSE